MNIDMKVVLANKDSVQAFCNDLVSKVLAKTLSVGKALEILDSLTDVEIRDKRRPEITAIIDKMLLSMGGCNAFIEENHEKDLILPEHITNRFHTGK